jgi:hypothetical protein
MTAFTKFNSFVEALAEKKHDLGTDTLKVMFSNVAPVAATNTVKADITEITPGNGYTAGGHALTVTSSAQTAGVYKLIANDLTVTAAGGSVGPFRYVVLYNDTAASDELIGFWDYGSAVTLADTEAFPIDFSATSGVLSLT